MALIEIPYHSEGTDGWKIPMPGDGCCQFCSREAALAFALKVAKEDQSTTAQLSYLCVEGGDGKWRLFTPDLLPLK